MSVYLLPDDVDTDLIIPGQYLAVTDPKALAAVCLSGYDPTLSAKLKPGDIILAGANFGCGSSREHAPIALRELGISCVIAKSFARIFYRNAINLGLPVLECPDMVDDYRIGDEIQVDMMNHRICNLTLQKGYAFFPFPASIQSILSAGGAIPMLRKHFLKGEDYEGH